MENTAINSNTPDETRENVIRLADDISRILRSLSVEGNPSVILRSLAEIVIFIRTNPQPVQQPPGRDRFAVDLNTFEQELADAVHKVRQHPLAEL